MKKIKNEVKIALLMAYGVIAMIVGVIISEMSGITKAMWTFGDILAWSGLAAFLGAIAWLFMINGRADKQEKADLESKK